MNHQEALDKLSGPGRLLKLEPSDTHELAGLLRTGRARLHDASERALSMESRFDLAYNAAHALCLAALRAKGYRPSQRYVVFQVLPHTLGLDASVWRVLDLCHRKRNLAEYEGLLEVDERLVKDLIEATHQVLLAMQASI